MMVFGKEYAAVYDALYYDKDYEKECDFIENIFKKYNCKPKTILDLGCGTGGHAIILAKRGYKITGIDRSLSMLQIAREKALKEGLKIEFIQGDITNFDIAGFHKMPSPLVGEGEGDELKGNKIKNYKKILRRKFDVVIAMFAVMSYQTTNEAVSAVCKFAKNSLNPGGLFTFDCWFGPAVLAEKPTDRMKEITLSNGDKIIRFAHSEIDILNHIVKVNYKLWRIKYNSNSKLQSASQLTETHETHIMRFFFPQEIKYFLRVAGFEQIHFYPFLEIEKELGERHWNITVVGK